jgi:ribosome biogenesis GTPase
MPSNEPHPTMTLSLDDEPRLRAIGLQPALVQALQNLPAQAGDRPMRVAQVQRDHVLLHDGAALHRARVAMSLADWLSARDDALAVGDWVLAAPDDFGDWHVCERVPPATQLKRLTNDGRGGPTRQVLVANVDTALLVMGLDHDFNLKRLERYLALTRLAGIAAVVLLTKADTVDEARRERCLHDARLRLPPEVPAWAVDGHDPAALAALQPWCTPGQTLVLLGSSGAGKSTLTNTLLGHTAQATGAVRSDDSHGHHTTTVRTLHALPGGACVIDTPGLRGLRLDAGEADALRTIFSDVAALAPQCRFRDCRHQGEPGCAVREAVPDERLRNYHKLLREARRDEMSALEKREQLAAWKRRARAGRARVAQKQGR